MKYFKDSEFQCPCCGKNEMNKPFCRKLDAAREIAGIPFKLNSAYRCKKHNNSVGGTEDSSHTKGLAADIYVFGTRERFLILNALLSVGFNRIGIGKNFVHVDNDLSKDEEVIWLY